MAKIADLPFLTEPVQMVDIPLSHGELRAMYQMNQALAEKLIPFYDAEKQSISIKKLGFLSVGERVALEELIAEQSSLNMLRMELGARIASDFGVSLAKLDEFMRDEKNREALTPYFAEMVRLQSLEQATEFRGIKIVATVLGRLVKVDEDEVQQFPTEFFSALLKFAEAEFSGTGGKEAAPASETTE